MALDLPGGDVTIPGVGSYPTVAVAAVGGGAIGLVVLILNRRKHAGAAPVAAVTGDAAAAAPAVAAAPAGMDPSAAISSLSQDFNGQISKQAADTAAALAAQQTAFQAALKAQADNSNAAISAFGTAFTQQQHDQQLRDQAAAEAQAARDAANAAAQASLWDRVVALFNQHPAVAPVTPPAAPAPAPGGGAATGGWTFADWQAYADNAPLLKWNTDQRRKLPAGSQLMVYEGNIRKSNAVINLPKDYDGAADTKRFSLSTHIGAESSLSRVARWTADDMKYDLSANPQWVYLKNLRRLVADTGSLNGTGFSGSLDGPSR